MKILKGFLAVSILSGLFCTTVESKILSPESYGQRLKRMSNTELKREYDRARKNLTADPKKLPNDIEADIKFANKPPYKIKMLNAVIKEVALRCSQSKTIEELATITDLFFKTEKPEQSNNKKFPSCACKSQQD